MTTRAAGGTWLVVGAAVAWNLLNLRAETLSVSYLNDSSVHEQMVRFATQQFTSFPSNTESGSKLHSSCHFSSSRARGPKWHRFSLKTIFQRSICKYDAGSLRNGSNSYIRRPADCKFIKLELWKRASGRHPELIGDHHQFWRHERNHFASHTVRNGRHAKWSEPAPDAESWSDCDVDCEFRSAVVWQSEWKS